MRKLFTIAMFICVAAPVFGQQRLTLDIPGLSERAKEEVNVTLDGPLLKLAARFLSNDQPDEAAVRDIASKLEGIYVRSYTFEHEGEYDKAIVDHLRSQLTTWKRVVSVKEKFRESSDVYVDMRGDNVVGLAIINAEPRELTIVNIVGSIDLDKLSKLEGQFGIPRMRRERSGD
jgi:hypothetical protein